MPRRCTRHRLRHAASHLPPPRAQRGSHQFFSDLLGRGRDGAGALFLAGPVLTSALIERKRDGEALEPEEVRALLRGYLAGEVADYQMSAFLMAVLFRGLSPEELSAMTRTMIDSGARLEFRDGGPPAVDKHSTGGVGDKVSLVLAPLLAEAGLRVPMIAGRGLGHTGGTLDKLEAIPGFRTDLEFDEFRAAVSAVGCAISGQTAEVAPLDGRLYALRDVTGTVPSIPLLASSIISKKAAEGVEALVLDVKCGSGAFIRDEEGALELARTLVDLARAEGLRAVALLTGMDEPLGHTVGNSLEVRESIEALRGEGPSDLREVTLALAAEAVAAVDVRGAAPVDAPEVGPLDARGDAPADARARLERILDEGRALERFARMIERQGGDPAAIENPDLLPAAPQRRVLEADATGHVTRVNAREIGLAAVELGAGRARVGDAIDPAVGFEICCAVGDEMEEGAPLVTIHAASEADAERAAARLRSAIRIAPESPPPTAPLVRGRVASCRARPKNGRITS